VAGKKIFLSVVIPVFNEEQVIREFIVRLKKTVQQIDCDYELLFVNDGSRDGTLSILRDEKKSDKKIRVINFSRNFGHQMAITAGMDQAQGDAVIVIDADLQDPPELIVDMVQKWQEGYDTVYARRTSRVGETLFKRWTAALFYRLIKKISNVDIPVDVGDFRLLSKRALVSLNQCRETHRYVRGLVAWLGYPQAFVDYARDKRFAGETKYPLSRMLRFSMDGISSFSILPLRLASWLGMFCAFFSFIYILYALYIKFVVQTAAPGWTAIVISVFLVGGVQLMCIGIMGEYIGVLHNEIKKRPLYVISEID